ncbi:hypothetical protein ATG_17280 [Desulfurococcaceae archaeon AG1]|jgi:hypothetical protein|nr:MAG: hypothetical protein DJ555_07120 [Desulfurococcaceae archaeon]GAY26524.1 hypothetical protein ATG_17280 [Desulfurococcaceae archaeon AG1]
MIFSTTEELVQHIDSVLRHVEKVYKIIAREIREKSNIVFLTSGWLKSPGCSSTIAFSLLRRADAYHTDLGFFTRYIAPYYEIRGENDLGLIVYDNPVEPWRGYIARHIKSLSLLGLRGIFIKSGRASTGKGEGSDTGNDFEVIEIPGDMDILLAHHILSLRAILEVSSERALSPRIARILDELRDLSPIIPSMIKEYGGVVKEIRTKIRDGVTLVATCVSRSFFEGLLLDGHGKFMIHDAQEFQESPGLEEHSMIVAYVDAERDLLPPSIITGRSTKLVLKTDPVISPIYFRLLSMITKISSTP